MIPINWPSKYLTTKNLEIEYSIPVRITVTAEDEPGIHFDLKLRAFPAKSFKEVEILYRTTLAKELHFYTQENNLDEVEKISINGTIVLSTLKKYMFANKETMVADLWKDKWQKWRIDDIPERLGK